jgi:hypothetical protein
VALLCCAVLCCAAPATTMDKSARAQFYLAKHDQIYTPEIIQLLIQQHYTNSLNQHARHSCIAGESTQFFLIRPNAIENQQESAINPGKIEVFDNITTQQRSVAIQYSFSTAGSLHLAPDEFPQKNNVARAFGYRVSSENQAHSGEFLLISCKIPQFALESSNAAAISAFDTIKINLTLPKLEISGPISQFNEVSAHLSVQNLREFVHINRILTVEQPETVISKEFQFIQPILLETFVKTIENRQNGPESQQILVNLAVTNNSKAEICLDQVEMTLLSSTFSFPKEKTTNFTTKLDNLTMLAGFHCELQRIPVEKSQNQTPSRQFFPVKLLPREKLHILYRISCKNPNVSGQIKEIRGKLAQFTTPITLRYNFLTETSELPLIQHGNLAWNYNFPNNSLFLAAKLAIFPQNHEENGAKQRFLPILLVLTNNSQRKFQFLLSFLKKTKDIKPNPSKIRPNHTNSEEKFTRSSEKSKEIKENGQHPSEFDAQNENFFDSIEELRSNNPSPMKVRPDLVPSGPFSPIFSPGSANFHFPFTNSQAALSALSSLGAEEPNSAEIREISKEIMGGQEKIEPRAVNLMGTPRQNERNCGHESEGEEIGFDFVLNRLESQGNTENWLNFPILPRSNIVLTELSVFLAEYRIILRDGLSGEAFTLAQ